jgi:phage protein D/phage baseplate assembly protein gpV
VTEKISYAPVVEAGGAPMKPEEYEALTHLRIDRQLGVVGRATLRFEDDGFDLATKTTFKLGDPLKVKQYPSTELFSGFIVGISLEQLPAEQPRLVVVADDAAHKLTRGSKTTTYLDTTYVSVVQQIAAKAGLQAQVRASGGGTQKYLLQAGSDLAFVDSIAARLGCSWWVDEGKFHFAPAGTPGGNVALTLNEDLFEFSVRASALRPTDVTVSGWSTDNLQNVVGQVQKATVWTTPPVFVAPYVNQATKLGAAKAGSGELSPFDQGEAKAAAQAQFDESVSASIVARGKAVVNGLIKPTAMVEVKNAGPATGKYYVTEVQHVYDVTGFHTRFVAGPLRPAGLVDTLGRAEPDPGFAIRGLVVGVVTNNNDPDKHGRIKVRYAGIPDNVESNWARVLTTSGGKNRGMVFLPEVDDEVLVGFEGGDARRPVVLGSLFSKKNTLPESTKILGAGKVAYRRITSRLGHIIELADGITPATQHVLIKLGTAEHSLRLGADNFVLEVAAGKPLTIKAGTAKFDINAMGDIAIEGKNINIKATQALNMEAPRATLKATGMVQVQGGQAQLKGMGPTSVEAGGPLTLKGITVAVN